MKNLNIPQEEQGLNEEKDGGNDEGRMEIFTLNHVPKHKSSGNCKKNGANDGIDTFKLPDSKIEQIEDKKNNVDNQNNKVKTR